MYISTLRKLLTRQETQTLFQQPEHPHSPTDSNRSDEEYERAMGSGGEILPAIITKHQETAEKDVTISSSRCSVLHYGSVSRRALQ